MDRVAGKIALVTGGGSGMGAATCELLAEEGATVIVTDVNFESARKLASRIGDRAIGLKLNVASEDEWKSVTAEVARRFGKLDILVNNAGVVLVADILDTTLEQFRFVNAVMSEGAFLGCKYCIPLLSAGGQGSIINVSSVASHMGYAGFVAYTAAKGAVRSMTKSIAMECQAKGYPIRCNSIHPGAIETPLFRASEGRTTELAIPDGPLPVGATGAPKDIAPLVLYLASNESRFVTGSEILIENGDVNCRYYPPPAS
jgi:3(or 17)beta-hydroxysteroid dehydrogenase